MGERYGGKSTLVNIMAGTVYPTLGRVVVNGNVGFCAQGNIHCEHMSILDLLIYFGMLRGYDLPRAKTESAKLLLELNLFDYYNASTSSLRPNQLRKLSIALAVIGEVDILLLDQPTAGLDTTTQREIWSFLLKYRGVKTLIITTEDSSEAELLADKLAIVYRGSLQCLGSPWYIKGLFRYGYTLTMICSNVFYPQRVIDLVKRHISVTETVHDANPIFVAPGELPDMPLSLVLHDASRQNMAEDFEQGSSSRKYRIQWKGTLLIYRQFISLAYRKLACMIMNWMPYTLIFTLSMVAVIISLLHLEPMDTKYRRNCPPRIDTALIFRNIRQEFQTEFWTDAVLNQITNFSERIQYYDSRMKIKHLGKITPATVVFELTDYKQNFLQVHLFSNNFCHDIILNDLLANIVLKIEKDNPLMIQTKVVKEDGYNDLYYVSSNYWCPIIGFVFAFAIPIAASVPYAEKSNFFKQQMHYAGVSSLMYWITIALVDILFYTIYSLCLLLCLMWFSDSDYTSSEWQLQTGYVVIFTISVISIAAPEAWYKWRSDIIRNLSRYSSLHDVRKISFLETEYIIFTITKTLAQLIPSVAFSQGLHDLFFVLTKLSNCQLSKMEPPETCDKIYNRLYDCCQMRCNLTKFYNFDCPDELSTKLLYQSGVLQAILFLILDLVIVILILYLYEARILNNETYSNYGTLVIPTDNEVLQEKFAIEQILANTLSDASTSQNYKLLVSRIHKRYGKTIGAGGLTFGVLANTGFALLGNSKSGKTTIMRILSGSEVSFGGDAFIGNARLTKHGSKYLSQITHCDETSTYTEALSIEDTLHLLMTLNGYSDSYRRERINMFIKAMQLEDYRRKKVHDVNQDVRRRFAIAQALLCGRDLVLLDEPTRGLTHVSKRLIWRMIRHYVLQGGTILLASSNLIECEALCNRIGILENGQIEYICTTTTLNRKVNRYYSVLLKLRILAISKQGILSLKRDLESRFRMQESNDYPEFICYSVSQSDASLSDLFTTLDQIKKTNRILEDYNISEERLRITAIKKKGIKFIKDERRRTEDYLSALKRAIEEVFSSKK
ncbi:ATP-binding cassette sub-family A member 2-like [Ctenocephalides felis]|uniref:ATP-binding cassette sub-family A member 2-like n=1 Tax=Ctenocephalides felis TaxID=7515 RepID=UPI000E6E4AE4|nr:ATP-binding cassette sub-family A member 2-like [Ctenocephalides felis]